MREAAFTWPSTMAARTPVSTGCIVPYVDGRTALHRLMAQAMDECAPAVPTMPAHNTAAHADGGTVGQSICVQQTSESKSDAPPRTAV